ncbi:MAG: ABC transporter ATP-binding protein [Desulfobacterales bacterium]|nr:ABC transporter ATP-binding protein [Desulfobacterales bacterium]MBL7101180.1 ABC transporter ATP-binding protein [Desulfobacteraceae bacterium]MBL7171726.1 ABC transporter ATP-binding protein [Desulfobacteraceae bacterium]
MIELSRITKIFNMGKANAFTALRGIDLRIDMGRITVFKGPSGSGKTTLLSIIGCMSRPTSGRIMVDNRETTSLPERFAARIRRDTFGFIFQNYNLIRGISALENIMIPAYPTGRKHAAVKRRAQELLRRLNMESKADKRVERLSGGEQQRVAISRALINDPSIIIADEPTAHLDTDLSWQFMEIMMGLKKDGKTILIASHDPLVSGYAGVDRGVGLRDGEIVEERAGQ